MISNMKNSNNDRSEKELSMEIDQLFVSIPEVIEYKNNKIVYDHDNLSIFEGKAKEMIKSRIPMFDAEHRNFDIFGAVLMSESHYVIPEDVDIEEEDASARKMAKTKLKWFAKARKMKSTKRVNQVLKSFGKTRKSDEKKRSHSK